MVEIFSHSFLKYTVLNLRRYIFMNIVIQREIIISIFINSSYD